ncbi:hypothetical protein HZS_7603 [Henneguya salminicola]|nr:hypothetical protein HZS_7603 [Henneguya salminicola]
MSRIGKVLEKASKIFTREPNFQTNKELTDMCDLVNQIQISDIIPRYVTNSKFKKTSILDYSEICDNNLLDAQIVFHSIASPQTNSLLHLTPTHGNIHSLHCIRIEHARIIITRQ